jgi:hypothetical protein
MLIAERKIVGQLKLVLHSLERSDGAAHVYRCLGLMEGFLITLGIKMEPAMMHTSHGARQESYEETVVRTTVKYLNSLPEELFNGF